MKKKSVDPKERQLVVATDHEWNVERGDDRGQHDRRLDRKEHENSQEQSPNPDNHQSSQDEDNN